MPKAENSKKNKFENNNPHIVKPQTIKKPNRPSPTNLNLRFESIFKAKNVAVPSQKMPLLPRPFASRELKQFHKFEFHLVKKLKENLTYQF